MKQLVILSGKGGTGKTSVCAAFAHLSGVTSQTAGSVFVDADVDAANLSLLLKPEHTQAHVFVGGSLAEIDAQRCTGCAACVDVCRYDAILPDEDRCPAYRVDAAACDGCAACFYICPSQAIRMVPQREGEWLQSATPFGTLFHAELLPGRENSGKLVTLVKQQARLWAEDNASPLVIIDGPPGIGCPVISASAGADLGLIVAEPGIAGQHDLQRVLATLQHFNIPTVFCINKADIYPEGSRQIRQAAQSAGIKVLGEIPYDESMLNAVLQGAPVTRLFPRSTSARAINIIWNNLIEDIITQGRPDDD